MAQTVKNLPVVQGIQVQSLGWEEPLEKGMVPIPVFWPRRLGSKETTCQAGDMGSIPDWGGSPGGRNSNPLRYLRVPRECHEQRSLVGYSPYSGKESDLPVEQACTFIQAIVLIIKSKMESISNTT